MHLPSTRAKALLTYADGLYLFDYWILTVAFALLFVSVGGSFRRPLVWLDGGTMIMVQLVGIWTFLLAPRASTGIDRHVSLSLIVAYTVTISTMTSMAALLWMQTRSTQRQTAILLLIGAGLFEVTWEVVWLASWLSNRDFAGSYYNYGDVLCFCCIGSAAVIMQGQAGRESSVLNPERSVESFLPALAALLAIAMVSGTVARQSDAWILVGLVLLCAALVLTRQRSVRKELKAMSTALALREADARLTELVRRSADLILVIDADGVIGFASPAAESMLSIAPAALQGRRGAELLGAAHQTQLANFIEGLRTAAAAPAPAPASMELRLNGSSGTDRIFKVSGSNQLTNPLIRGIVLTVTDVTEQRVLEREVLDAATRERTRLCGDIHDGLGQELVGIAMLLQGAATVPDPDPVVHKAQLRTVIGHVNRSIQIARDLARGLSPLHVVRGSLSGALRRLAADSGARIPVHLAIDAAIDESQLDDISADHIYRIAQEAINNAIAHSNCTGIDITLRAEDSGLVLRVADDGNGFDPRSTDFPGLGLKLMEYRARLVGGTFRVDPLPNSGSSVVVTIPPRSATEFATSRRNYRRPAVS
jgi:PAS domain S-box-containing protein